jgi:hypothetical protein
MNRLRLPGVLAVCVVVAGSLAVATSCATNADAKSTVSSMSSFGLEVAKVKDSIDGALKGLETVVGSQPADVRANIDAYSKSVDALDGQAKVVKRRADEMKSMGDEFFKEWEPPKSVSKERRAELTSSFAKIKADMGSAKDAFAPFLAALKDVQGYLKVDPSTKAAESISGLIQKAKDAGAQVKSHIDAVLNQVNSVRGMLPTKGS